MKNILLLLLFALAACIERREEKRNASEGVPNVVVPDPNIAYTDSLANADIDGKSEYIDSAHFHIIRRSYPSGKKYLNIYQNKLTKLDDWKEYYENGNLKNEGTMISSLHNYIGIWKYYAPDGKLDSIVNYDKRHKISYFKALEIAKTKGYEMPNITVDLTENIQQKYWRISRWTETGNGRVAETILIGCQTGKVITPDYILSAVY